MLSVTSEERFNASSYWFGRRHCWFGSLSPAGGFDLKDPCIHTRNISKTQLHGTVWNCCRTVSLRLCYYHKCLSTSRLLATILSKDNTTVKHLQESVRNCYSYIVTNFQNLWVYNKLDSFFVRVKTTNTKTSPVGGMQNNNQALGNVQLEQTEQWSANKVYSISTRWTASLGLCCIALSPTDEDRRCKWLAVSFTDSLRCDLISVRHMKVYYNYKNYLNILRDALTSNST